MVLEAILPDQAAAVKVKLPVETGKIFVSNVVVM